MRKLLTSAFLCVASLGTAFAGQKLSPELANANPQGAIKVIVQWRHHPGSLEHGKVFKRGGHLRHSYLKVRAGSYSMPAQALQDLANDPDVEYVAPDRPLHGLLDYSAVAINAPAALAQGFDGKGIAVAVIDSGMISNADLDQRQIVYSQDFTGEFPMGSDVSATSNAPDTFGHGQHVAGIIASTGSSSNCPTCTRSLKGIAPAATLLDLRVLDENGQGTDSAVIAAIDQAIALKDVYNIRVINLSLGRPVFESYTQDPLCQAAEEAWKAGIVVVVAAGNNGRDNSTGNNGYGTISAPGNDPYVLTVGAMKSMQTYDRGDDLIASYSSKGPTAFDSIVKPDVVAPGNQIVSLLASNTATLPSAYPENIPPQSYYDGLNDSTPSPAYFTLSGTSMATPVVSAAVADLLEAQPALTPDQVKFRLMLTASKTFPASSVAVDNVTGQTFLSYYDAFTIGAGYLDLAAALADKTLAQGTALSPAVGFDPDSNSFYLLSDISAVWQPAGISSPFSLSVIWGQSLVDASSTSWGQTSASSIIWGQTSAASTSWGQRVASTSTSWGQHVNASSVSWGQVSADSTSWGQHVDATSTSWGQRVGSTSTSWGQHVQSTSTSWGQRVDATSTSWGQRIAAASTAADESGVITLRGEQ